MLSKAGDQNSNHTCFHAFTIRPNYVKNGHAERNTVLYKHETFISGSQFTGQEQFWLYILYDSIKNTK